MAENWQSYSVVIPTGAGANATVKWRNLLFLSSARTVLLTRHSPPHSITEERPE